MKIYYFGTFEKDYSRNVIFIESMRSIGIDVALINEEVREQDALRYGSVFNLVKLGVKFIKAYATLLIKLLKIKDSKYLFIGYPSHLDVIFFYLPAKLKGMKIFFNPLVSLYDTFVFDRRIFKENSIIAKILYMIDKYAFILSDVVFIDTNTHKIFLSGFFKVDERKFRVVPVGAMREFLENENEVQKSKNFTVLYVGKYIPLHGVDIIVKSAKLLEGEKIKFIFVGRGQLYSEIRKMVDVLKMKNIDFIDWVERKELNRLIKSSDVVLGIFRGNGKAIRVVPNKVFDALACGALVITAKTQAMEEFFKDKEDLLMVEPENPEDLAEKIKWVYENKEEAKKISIKGKKRFHEVASFDVLGRLIEKIILES
ncbi:MAG: glycosyltransferase [Proteobacteria bacterium]|nr:glycosyltransferase [Pseudomonadota bacterium]